jgi:hypothetical protein
MNTNFKGIIWIAGHFGIIIREQVEEFVYRNKYSQVSANRTLAKLEMQNLLKRIDRGKRKTDGYKLTNNGIKYFKKEFGYEPKNYNSGDKLNHSISILNFYGHIIRDMVLKKKIQNDYNIIEEKNKLVFSVQRQLKYTLGDDIKIIEPDAFGMYKYKDKKARVFWLEIENSDRKAQYVAKKTLDNYENYYKSGYWKREKWQMKDKKVFPYILIVAYSEYKAKELIEHFKKKIKIEELKHNYYFSDYKSLKEKGISEDIWYNINKQKVSIFK